MVKKENNKIRDWWRRKSLLGKILIVVGIIVGISFLLLVFYFFIFGLIRPFQEEVTQDRPFMKKLCEMQSGCSPDMGDYACSHGGVLLDESILSTLGNYHGCNKSTRGYWLMGEAGVWTGYIPVEICNCKLGDEVEEYDAEKYEKEVSPGEMHGGVDFSDIKINFTGPISNEMAAILKNTSTQSYVKDGDDIYFQIGITPKKPELTPLVIGFSKLTPDADEVINISVVVINDGKVDITEAFNVRFSGELIYPNGSPGGHYNIGEKIVNGLDIDEDKLVSISFSSSLIGYHNITVSVDYDNRIGEISELDNEISEVIEVVDPNPVAEIIYPESGTQYGVGETFQLIGMGIDRKDGELDESSHGWTSDKEGYLGSGFMFPTNLSVLGDHTITLRVEDSDGNVAVDEISILIG